MRKDENGSESLETTLRWLIGNLALKDRSLRNLLRAQANYGGRRRK